MMRRARGFTLIEIMVGLVIGMLGVIVIMQILETAERQKRTTTTGSDAQVNGTLALYTLERDVRLAGYGLASVNLLNCSVNVYNSARTPNLFSFQAAPVVINPAGIPAGDTGSDLLQVVYGNSAGVVEADTLATTSTFPNYGMNNVAALAAGEFILFAEAAKACWLAQITAVASPTITTAANQWNPATGPGVTYSNLARLFNAGQAPRVLVYAVRNGRLTQCDMLVNPCDDATRTGDGAVWVEVSPGIVGLSAAYGRDTGAVSVSARAAIPDTWDQTAPATDATDTPANACAWARIPALSIALLARGSQYEASAVTATAPQWHVGGGGTLTVTAIPNWQNYRYKVFQTVVPLRNVVWMDRTGC